MGEFSLLIATIGYFTRCQQQKKSSIEKCTGLSAWRVGRWSDVKEKISE